MVNLFAIIGVLAIIYVAARGMSVKLRPKFCPSCNGKGYWASTRGEKNTCELCDGTGTQLQRRKR